MRPPSLSGIHLRAGDVSDLESTYTNRVVPTTKQLAASLKKAWARSGGAKASNKRRGRRRHRTRSGGAVEGHVVYLATDAVNANYVADEIASQLAPSRPRSSSKGAAGTSSSPSSSPPPAPPPRVVLDPDMYRPVHGAHTTAFAHGGLNGSHELTVPYEIATEIVAKMSISEAAKLQDRVRREALLDLYILSRCEQLAAAASSMFAVAGRLWGVGHAAARGVEQAGSSGGYRGAQRRGAAWTDLDEVVSGELATGFLRGMRNGTERLVTEASATRWHCRECWAVRPPVSSQSSPLTRPPRSLSFSMQLFTPPPRFGPQRPPPHPPATGVHVTRRWRRLRVTRMRAAASRRSSAVMRPS